MNQALIVDGRMECGRCCIVKPLEMFGANGSDRRGRPMKRSWCLKCEAERARDRKAGMAMGTKPRRTVERLPIPSSLGRPITVGDIGWIAGFLEGEGSFLGGPARGNGAQVVANQLQREPLDRLATMLGGRVVCRKKTKAKNYIHEWRVSSNRARGIMLTVYSLMSPRRKAQIRRALGIESEAVAA